MANIYIKMMMKSIKCIEVSFKKNVSIPVGTLMLFYLTLIYYSFSKLKVKALG